VPLCERHCIAAVASPPCLVGRTLPRTPEDFVDCRCLNARLAGRIYRWEFSLKGRDVEIEVRDPLPTKRRRYPARRSG
jgi:DNA-binding transcriptional LysR family regulator